MKLLKHIFNRDGEEWTVEQSESERLTNIGGFLMTHQDRGKLKVNARLSHEDKVRGRNHLMGKLDETPIGTSATWIWKP